ncbi:MAG: 30S ribosomal protein S7 [Actinobacteria bacterium RBG_16_68_21]|nr:MAG: 30S ribosomal protein S7 [Actinobacteria bacterium RBG_16_68_21]
MRRAPAEVRHLEPDPVFRSTLVSQIINKVLWKGNKEQARQIVYGALEIVEKRAGQDPITVLKKAIDNVRPSVEVRSRRVGGSAYQVPVEVRPRRGSTLAVRWLVDFARKRREHTMAERLANEILDASTRQGSAFKRREDVHKMAESNKAFAHYRW